MPKSIYLAASDSECDGRIRGVAGMSVEIAERLPEIPLTLALHRKGAHVNSGQCIVRGVPRPAAVAGIKSMRPRCYRWCVAVFVDANTGDSTGACQCP